MEQFKERETHTDSENNCLDFLCMVILRIDYYHWTWNIQYWEGEKKFSTNKN